jgi:hypothetical protein
MRKAHTQTDPHGAGAVEEMSGASTGRESGAVEEEAGPASPEEAPGANPMRFLLLYLGLPLLLLLVASVIMTPCN